MRKSLVIAASFITYLSSVPLALAAGVDPCSSGNPQFRSLCNLGQNGEIGKAIGNVINLLFLVAAIIALFYLVQGGIRWITSGGDTKNVEGARNQIIAAAIGLGITFLSYLIINLLLNFFLPGTNGLGGLNLPTINQ